MQNKTMQAFEKTSSDTAHRYAILDRQDKQELDEIVALGTLLCGVPVCLISFGSAHDQWFQGTVGTTDASPLRSLMLCPGTGTDQCRSDIGDADSGYLEPVYLAGQPLPMRFHARAPLLAADGQRLGYLAVFDHLPRILSTQQRTGLELLATMVVRQMEARLAALENRRAMHFFETLIEHCPVTIAVKKILKDKTNGTGVMMCWNPAATEMTGVPAEAILGRNNHEIFAPECAARNFAHEAEVLRTRASVTEPVYPVRHADGNTRLLRLTSIPLLDSTGEVEFLVTIAEDNTALLDQQKALRRSHAELAAINDALPLGLYHTDTAGHCTYFNRCAEDITGLSTGDAAGLGWLQTVHPQDLHGIREEFEQACETQRKYQKQFRMLRPDGRMVEVRAQAVPFSVDGVFSGFVGTLKDISERQALARSAATNERRLRLVMDNIPALVTHVDRDLQLRYINSVSRTMLKTEPEDMIGKSIMETYPAKAIEILTPQLKRVLAGESVLFDTHINLTGIDSYYQSHYMPEFDEQGQVVGFFGMAFNVTARKQAEIQSAANEKRLRMITDNLPVAITYLDRHQRYQFANATMHNWYGRSGSSVQGLRADEVMNDAEYYGDLAHMHNALAGMRVDFEKPAGPGQPRYLHTTYLPDIGSDGEVQGIYTLSNDITTLKQNEARLQQMARFDMLTGLPNRGHFHETLESALARCNRAGQSIAVLFLDIDHFKNINDTLGHAMGDLVLKEFAARLMASVRGTDMAARLAGDEFVILLEGVKSVQDTSFVARKVLEQVARPWLINGGKSRRGPLVVSTSIGVVYDEQHTHTVAELIALADEMLYEAKSAGRGTFRTRTV